MYGDKDTAAKISIHSAARAETAMPLAGLTVVIYFNPLRREGGDPAFQPVPSSHGISIHSAARAET